MTSEGSLQPIATLRKKKRNCADSTCLVGRARTSRGRADAGSRMAELSCASLTHPLLLLRMSIDHLISRSKLWLAICTSIFEATW